MKKMLFLCTAVLAVGIASAQDTDTIYSKNIVGYNTIPEIRADNMTMWGANFELVGTDSAKGISINELFVDRGDFTGADSATDADQLLLWNATDGYVAYYFGDSGGDWGEGYDRKWYAFTDDSEPTEDLVSPGVAGWFVRKGPALTSVTLAGQVSQIDSFALDVRADNMTMFSNPYPVPFVLNDELNDWSAATGADSATDADQILIWNAVDGYVAYYFGDSGGDWGEGYDRKWYAFADDSEPTSDAMPVACAAWYVRNGAATTFAISKPF